jgi:hypothetical protein
MRKKTGKEKINKIENSAMLLLLESKDINNSLLLQVKNKQKLNI